MSKPQPRSDAHDDVLLDLILRASRAITELVDRVEILEAKQQAADNGNLFNQTETIRESTELKRELDELRHVVVAEPPREWLTVDEAAALVGRSTVTVRSWCKNDHIGTFYKRVWRINKALLHQFYVARFGEDRLPAGLRDQG